MLNPNHHKHAHPKSFSISLVVCIIFALASFASAADDKLTNRRAQEALWQYLKGHADKVDVIGVLEVPQQNAAIADITITKWLLARPKNDAVTAYAFGKGGGTFEWSGQAKAIFIKYNDGRWILKKIETSIGVFDNLNIPAVGPVAAPPTFPTTTPYREVRVSLAKMGWQQFRVPTSPGCNWDNCKQFPETIQCFGTGRAPCFYSWRRGSAQMIVVAVGEGDQYFADAKSCGAISKAPPPSGAWTCD